MAEEKNRGLTRREFIRIVGAGGAGLVVGGVAGSRLFPQKAKAGVPSKWDQEAEVVVIGSGFAGLAAAIEARDAGADVVILEKMPHPGGNSAINGGQYAAWTSRIRKKLNLPEDSPEIMLQDMMEAGANLNWKELAQKVAEESADGIEWLIDMGVQFMDTVIQAGGHSRPRTHQTVNMSGGDIVKAQLNAVKDRGIPLLTEHKVVQIFRESPNEGRVLGVEVDHKGEKIFLKAKKGIVLAAGGFSRNVDLRMKYVPFLTSEIPSTNHPGATGEVMLLAMEIGASTTQLDWIQLYPFADPKTGVLDKVAVVPFTAPAYCIYVDKNGKRFVNELANRKVCADAQIFGLGEKPSWTVFDNSSIEKFTSRKIVDKGVADGRVLKAETLEELAQKAGFDPAGIKETVERYNRMVEKGVDEDFGKPSMKAKIQEPPFYAIPQWPSVHHTMGGLQITKEAQVLDLQGKVIPGLYAAGEITGGVHGAVRLGSVAIPDCIVFGRTAGRNVVEAESL
ncbi:MAG: Flavocytochrome c [Synergistales bacterium 54_24]|nr:MAG: Flavocytochrome c [Synergistales bacterium 54_24]